MFVFESENPLFEFEYATPHRDLLLALPPTSSSSTIYHLFFAHSVVAETYARNGLTFLFSVIHEILIKEIFNLAVSIFRFLFITINFNYHFLLRGLSADVIRQPSCLITLPQAASRLRWLACQRKPNEHRGASSNPRTRKTRTSTQRHTETRS